VHTTADETSRHVALPLPSVQSLVLFGGGLAIAASFLDARAWPLAWLGLIPLFAIAPAAGSPRLALRCGMIAGLATNVPAFYWLIETMHRFGGFPLALAIFFYLVLSLYGALQFGIVAVLLERAGPAASVLLAPLVWTAIEFLYPNLFPWRLGHSQRAVALLLQSGDLAGPYALSFAMAWVASAATRVRQEPRSLATAGLGVLLLLAYGVWRTPQVDRSIAASPALSVGIVQGNLGLDEKRHVNQFAANVARYRRLSAQIEPAPGLLVWPETVVEWGIPHDADALGSLDPYPGAAAPLLFGALSYREEAGDEIWFNSAFLRNTSGGLNGHYDKVVLMPFGEFLPFAGTFPWLRELSPASGDFRAGSGPVVLTVSPQARIAPLICYEDLLAGLTRRAVRDGATLLVTLANDAWFGDTVALKQHETLALWRAIENRRYLVRATNTGLTSVIDPFGKAVLTLPTVVATSARAETRLLEVTTVYQSWGDAFAWAAVGCAFAFLVAQRPWPRRAILH
jgi:apolipoprotein N-acyltransferase